MLQTYFQIGFWHILVRLSNNGIVQIGSSSNLKLVNRKYIANRIHVEVIFLWIYERIAFWSVNGECGFSIEILVEHFLECVKSVLYMLMLTFTLSLRSSYSVFFCSLRKLRGYLRYLNLAFSLQFAYRLLFLFLVCFSFKM